MGIKEDIKDWRGSYDFTILMEATLFRRENILRWSLHELKFDVNEQNGLGKTALHYAVAYNEMQCARLLLDVGSQHLKDRYGSTPLEYAKSYGHKEM